MDNFIDYVGLFFAVGVAIMIEVLLGTATVCFIIAICSSTAPLGAQIFGSIVAGLTGFFIMGFTAVGIWCVGQGY